MNEGIEELISNLYEMVQDAWSLPLSADKCVLERDKVLDILDEISNNLPIEIKQAKKIVETKELLLTTAKNDADTLLEEAENKAREMISQEAVTARAKEEAAQMISDAEDKANEMIENTNKKIKSLKQATFSYLVDSLKSSEETIHGALDQVSSARAKLDTVLTALAPSAEASAPAVPEAEE